jgi:ribonuclease BN (tRNA processing enzyme)
MTGAIPASWGGRKKRLKIVGPEGVQRITEGLWAFTSADRDIRIAAGEIDPEMHRVEAEVLQEVGQSYAMPVIVARDLTVIRFGAAIDLPRFFHPAATGVRLMFTPIGAG